MNSKSVLVLLLAAALTTACEENAVQTIAGPPAGGASIKFFNFAPGSPAVNFYANDAKVTAILATTCTVITDDNREQCTTTGAESTDGVAYGSAGNGANAWYSDIAPGQYTISGRIAAATNKGLAIASAQANLAAGKFYSFYMSGIYDATSKTADAFIIEDVLPPVDYTKAQVRFVNAISNSNPLTLYVKNTTTLAETAHGSATAYKSATAFIALEPGTYDLAVRSGGTTNLITRLNVGFAEGRIYTITARGNVNTASTLALDNTANR